MGADASVAFLQFHAFSGAQEGRTGGRGGGTPFYEAVLRAREQRGGGGVSGWFAVQKLVGGVE